MAISKALRSITGRQTTAGAAEETVLLSLDGSAPAALVAIPADQEMIISDWTVTAEAAGRFRLQQTTDGVVFFDIYLLRVATDGTVAVVGLSTPLHIAGGPTTAIRIRVETPAGASAVMTSLRAYTDPNTFSS